MTNAEIILQTLDQRLNAKVEITLFGRAALQLGFPAGEDEYALSQDIDGVLWLGQAEELLRRSNFWEAVESVNRELADRNLYISHLFDETQVILRPDWRTQRVIIPGTWQRLLLHRLSDADLFLSKLMRYDPLDMKDASFIADQAGWTQADMARIINQARVPDIADIREQFALCSKKFL
jgi:hypothetical protein